MPFPEYSLYNLHYQHKEVKKASILPYRQLPEMKKPQKLKNAIFLSIY